MWRSNCEDSNPTCAFRWREAVQASGGTAETLNSVFFTEFSVAGKMPKNVSHIVVDSTVKAVGPAVRVV